MILVAVPHSALFDILLIIHVLVGLVSLVVFGVMYGSLATLSKAVDDAPWPAGPARFFAPGHEIGGRILYLIPVTGIALVSSSHGDSTYHDAFVQIGFGLWLVAMLIAELVVFPSTQQLRRHLAVTPVATPDQPWRSKVTIARWALDGVMVAVVAGAVVMLVQP